MDKVQLLQKKLDNHISEYEMNRAADEKRWIHLMESQEKNAQAIAELTESTKSILSFWQNTNGAVNVLSALGRFAAWLSSFAIMVAIYQWFYGK